MYHKYWWIKNRWCSRLTFVYASYSDKSDSLWICSEEGTTKFINDAITNDDTNKCCKYKSKLLE